MKKVLIINDSGFERMVLRDQVQNLGFEVKATDEFGGLRLIQNFHPDIVIVNLTMTDISGDKLIEQIKTLEPDTRCFLSTCSRNPQQHYENQIIDGVLMTPATLEQLEIILNHQVSYPLSIQIQKNHQTRIPTNPSDDHKLSTVVIESSMNDTGSFNSNAFKFCPYCGKHLEKTEPKFIFCPFCGSQL